MADKISAVTAQNADNRLALAPDGTVMRVPARKLPPDLSDAVKAAAAAADAAVGSAADAASAAKQAEDKAAQALKLAQRALPKVLFIGVGNAIVYRFVIEDKTVLTIGRSGDGRAVFSNPTNNTYDIIINSATNPGIQPAILPHGTWSTPNNLNRGSCCCIITQNMLINLAYAAQDNNGPSYMQAIGVDAIIQ